MKLDYEEITPCLKETSKMWDELLKRDPNDSSLEYLLKDAIKKGKQFDLYIGQSF